MPKAIIIILFVLLLIYLSSKLFINKSTPTRTLTQNIKEEIFILEIADNPYLQAKGLSGRTHLCQNCGMLFIFNKEIIQSFWMKDTLIPLDIIFINKSGQITDIYTASPEPKKSDLQLKIYQSSQAAKYVIELNAGTAVKIGLNKGDILDLNL